MPRSARLTLRLLALLLLMQWGGGPFPHQGAMALVGEAVVICSPDGLHTVRLGPDGTPVKPSPSTAACCLLFQVPMSGGDLVPLPTLPEPRVVAAPDTAVLAAVRTLSFRPAPRAHQSRAPPIS
jgi:hypothetical protein